MKTSKQFNKFFGEKITIILRLCFLSRQKKTTSEEENVGKKGETVNRQKLSEKVRNSTK